MTSHTPQFLERARMVLPASSDELLLRGITAEITDRIVALKKASLPLRAKYGSTESLEQKIKSEGVSPDDHRLYTDLLEWKAIRHELAELVDLLEALWPFRYSLASPYRRPCGLEERLISEVKTHE